MDAPASHDIAADPAWLAERADFRSGALSFAHLSRERHRDVAFLNRHSIPAELERRTLSWSEAISAPKPRAPIHFVFHSGLACSTLIARALDLEGTVMTLKEPELLSDVVRLRLQGGSAADCQRALEGVLGLLARPFVPGEAVVVKVDSVSNALARSILETSPESQALCLHAPLPDFLSSIAAKGLSGRLWGRRLLAGLRNAGIVDLGFSDSDYLGQTDLQVAACAWMGMHRIFAAVIDRFGAGRVRSVDSRTFTTRPEASLGAIADHFRLAIAAEQVKAIVAGPVFTRHAKTGERFDLEARDETLGNAMGAHSEEIEAVTQWAGAVAEHFGFPIELPAPLVPAAP